MDSKEQVRLVYHRINVAEGEEWAELYKDGCILDPIGIYFESCEFKSRIYNSWFCGYKYVLYNGRYISFRK